MQEIERKFLVKKLPDLSNKDSINYERYFLKIESDYEERIQKKGGVYERDFHNTALNVSLNRRTIKSYKARGLT